MKDMIAEAAINRMWDVVRFAKYAGMLLGMVFSFLDGPPVRWSFG